ncbi:hypothetical protein M0R19_02710 [Candidatus Pacearchaeota archaeon]|jgi:hypothetical protein|nr:hypothetical protein [Candidatus Pacearchaeota archaeon]
MTLKIGIGDKIKCIDNYFKDDPNSPFRISEIELPKRGNYYTVREITGESSIHPGIRLQEIKNKKYYFGKLHRWEEPSFGLHHFDY